MNAASDILVVGAGPAGLAVSACLRRAGLGHTLVERESGVASSWRHHYDRLHLHTARQLSALPFMPWPSATPRYPSRDQVIAYLSTYAAELAVPPRFGVEVRGIARHGERFEVETGTGTLSTRFVVVATGCNAVANRPRWPGLAGFGGSLMHTQDYRRADPFIGRRTLVVGCGNSGMEIALDLAEHGVDVTMAVRGPLHVVPRDLFGLPAQRIAVWMSPLPLLVRDRLAAAVTRLTVGDLLPWGLERPRLGLERTLDDSGRVPVLDIGALGLIKAGRIRVMPAIDHVLPGAVCFTHGVVQPFEAILLATGYSPGLQRIVAGFDTIADARGRPDRSGGESGIRGLFFVGFRTPLTGALREIGIEARRVARLLKARVEG